MGKISLVDPLIDSGAAGLGKYSHGAVVVRNFRLHSRPVGSDAGRSDAERSQGDTVGP